MEAADLGLTADELQQLNTLSIELHGGSHGSVKAGCVESSIGAAEMAEYYAGTGDGSLGLCFIGSLMFYLIKNHCYTDGNKRTGLAAALRALYILGLTLDTTQDELRDYCLAIASGTIGTSEEVVGWLAQHIVAGEASA